MHTAATDNIIATYVYFAVVAKACQILPVFFKLLPDPLVELGQEFCFAGKLSQLGRLKNSAASVHSSAQTLSLMCSHWVEVGWMDTPELSHNPNKNTHRNGTTASLQEGLGFKRFRRGRS